MGSVCYVGVWSCNAAIFVSYQQYSTGSQMLSNDALEDSRYSLMCGGNEARGLMALCKNSGSNYGLLLQVQIMLRFFFFCPFPSASHVRCVYLFPRKISSRFSLLRVSFANTGCLRVCEWLFDFEMSICRFKQRSIHTG